MEDLKRLEEKQAKWAENIDKNLDEILKDIQKCKNSSIAPLKKTFKDKIETIGNENKEYHTALTKFGKLIDKEFINNIETAYKEWDMDPNIILEIILEFFYQTGSFECGSCFEKESNQTLHNKHLFSELANLITSLNNGDMNLLIEWSEGCNCSELTYQIHQYVYLDLLSKKQVSQCLQYAKKHFSGKSDRNQWLLGALVYVNKLNTSPYAHLFQKNRVQDIKNLLVQEYCKIHMIPVKSHLYTLLACGNESLPLILKFLSKGIESLNQKSSQMPFEIPLDSQFVFQSIFSCPLSKEISVNPMMLPCGHVISLNSLEKLRGNRITFKCPYCPMECQKNTCREIKF